LDNTRALMPLKTKIRLHEDISFKASLRLTKFLKEKKINCPLKNYSIFKKLRNCVMSEANFAFKYSNCFDFRSYMKIFEQLPNKQRNILSQAILIQSTRPVPVHKSHFNRSSPIIIAIAPSLIGSAVIFKYLEIVEKLNIIVVFTENLSSSQLRQKMFYEGSGDLIVLPLTSAHIFIFKTTRFYYVPIRLLPRGTHGLVLPGSFYSVHSDRFDGTDFISIGNLTARSYFGQLTVLGLLNRNQLMGDSLSICSIESVQSILDANFGIVTFFPIDKIIDNFGLGYRLQLDHLEVSSSESVLFAKEHLSKSEVFSLELQYWISKALEAIKNRYVLKLVVDTLFCDNTFMNVMTETVRAIGKVG